MNMIRPNSILECSRCSNNSNLDKRLSNLSKTLRLIIEIIDCK